MLRFTRSATRHAGADPSASVAARHRRHRTALRQLDRRALERDGWRTTLEFRENHARSDRGVLTDVDAVWIAEAERSDPETGAVVVLSASARSESRVWARLSTSARQIASKSSAERPVVSAG